MSEHDVAETEPSPVIVERDGEVLIVTLNRPRALNAITRAMTEDLIEAWVEAANPAIRAVLLTGNGRGFCSGADLQNGGWARPNETEAELQARASRPGAGGQGLQQMFNPHVLTLTGLRKAVVCAVNGPTAGAGISLACSADIRIASESATFSPGFVRIGVIPDMGASFLVSRLIGYGRAFDFLCSGDRIDARRALEIGLVNEVVAPNELFEHALARAHKFAAMPGLAVELTKQLLNRAHNGTLPELLNEEARAQALAVSDPSRAAARASVVASLSRRGKDDDN